MKFHHQDSQDCRWQAAKRKKPFTPVMRRALGRVKISEDELKVGESVMAKCRETIRAYFADENAKNYTDSSLS